jgi:S1-C subfamily serine protease
MFKRSVKLGVIAASLVYLGSATVLADHAGPYHGGGSHMMHPLPQIHMTETQKGVERDPPRLGVAITPLNQAMLDDLGLEYGVRIDGVRPGSVAEQAGLKAGDLVTALSDRPVYSPERMQHLVREAGDSMTIAVKRGDEALRLLASFPSESANPASTGRAILGLRVQMMTPDLQEAFGATQGQGVLVSQVISDSAAARAGLRAGDVITAIDTASVSSVRSLHQALAAHSPGDEVNIDILRKGETMSVAVALGAHPMATQVQAGKRWGSYHGKHGCDMKKRWQAS